MLRTLGLILVKGGPALRAFTPQLQTTFVKGLSGPARQARVEAIQASALLMPLATRVDPLAKELVAGSLGKMLPSGAGGTAGAAAAQTAMLEALSAVLKEGGKKVKLPDTIPTALDASKELLCHEGEGVREGAAKVMGAACELLGVEVTTELVESETLNDDKGDSASVRHGKACACHRALAPSVGPKLDDNARDEMTELIVSHTKKDDNRAVEEAACVAIGAAVGSAPNPAAALRKVEPLSLEVMSSQGSNDMEAQRALAKGLCLAIRLCDKGDGVTFVGKALLGAPLQLAMSGAQRVQFACNNALWSALDVANGTAGLDSHVEVANFDNSKAMKSLHAKALTRIKGVTDDDQSG